MAVKDVRFEVIDSLADDERHRDSDRKIATVELQFGICKLTIRRKAAARVHLLK